LKETVPVILDTDIGSDIDDAVALAYLLAEPRCDLLGVTTVTGDVTKRAALAQLLCEAAGKPSIPVHCGAPGVLLDGPGQPGVPQYEAVRDLAHRIDLPPATAVEFLRRTIQERPGEVTLLSVGPLTNVALLFATDPETPALLRQWVSMAGDFTGAGVQKNEWNARCDPLATAVAFRHQTPRHRHFGLNVTLRCRLAADEVRRRFTGPLLGLVAKMAEVWFSDRDEIAFHDPLAAVAVFEESLCEYRRGVVSADSPTGSTSFVEAPDGHDYVASDVRPEGFFEAFFAPFEVEPGAKRGAA
jgi:purine nucleosidase